MAIGVKVTLLCRVMLFLLHYINHNIAMFNVCVSALLLASLVHRVAWFGDRLMVQ